MKIYNCICAATFFLLIQNIHATVILNVDRNNVLTGAQNVDVGGALYDVEFREGTFFDVFSDIGGLDATDLMMANLFSNALLDQVFLDIDPVRHLSFDSNPFLTFGCHRVELCVAMTPYGIETVYEDRDMDGQFERIYDLMNYSGAFNFPFSQSCTRDEFGNTTCTLFDPDYISMRRYHVGDDTRYDG